MPQLRYITPEEAKRHRKLIAGIDYREDNMALVTCYTREPDPNNPKFDMVVYYGDVRGHAVEENDLVKPHYIYILSNPSIPGVLKIGYTERTVLERVKEINQAPGVIIPWEARWTYKCPNGRALEGEIHSHLQQMGLRPNTKREGFVIDLNEAIHIIEELGKKHNGK